jgi:hypothetical protein
MLRQIVSISLAMTACATFIHTRANAATLTVIPVDTLQKNPGDSITFKFVVNPVASNPLDLDIPNRNIITFMGFGYQYDPDELFFREVNYIKPIFTRFSNTTTIIEITFDVLRSIKDGQSDFNAQVSYIDFLGGSRDSPAAPEILDVQPVPEPLTIFGATTALGYGVILKREFSKKKRS